MPMSMNTQQNGTPATRSVLFAVLLIVSVVLMTVYGQEGDEGTLHSVQSSVMGVSGRVAGVGAGVGAATEAAATAASDVTADPTTLEGLRAQNSELRELLAEAEEYRQENERLRGLLDMKQVSGVTGPIARVIGRSTNAWDQSITIDIGSEEGVKSGMTVMGASGVIGQVSRASEHSSSVRLLTDPNSGAAVMVQSSRANGIVRGSLSGLLHLEDVDEEELPEVGDVILTSGLGGSYERGLIVGAVVSLGDSTDANAIVVNPNDSAKMLEEVIVVFKAPQVSTSSNASSGSAPAQAQDGEQEGTEGVDVQVSTNGQGADAGSYPGDDGAYQDDGGAYQDDGGAYLDDGSAYQEDGGTADQGWE